MQGQIQCKILYPCDWLPQATSREIRGKLGNWKDRRGSFIPHNTGLHKLIPISAMNCWHIEIKVMGCLRQPHGRFVGNWATERTDIGLSYRNTGLHKLSVSGSSLQWSENEVMATVCPLFIKHRGAWFNWIRKTADVTETANSIRQNTHTCCCKGDVGVDMSAQGMEVKRDYWYFMKNGFQEVRGKHRAKIPF